MLLASHLELHSSSSEDAPTGGELWNFVLVMMKGQELPVRTKYEWEMSHDTSELVQTEFIQKKPRLKKCNYEQNMKIVIPVKNIGFKFKITTKKK